MRRTFVFLLGAQHLNTFLLGKSLNLQGKKPPLHPNTHTHARTHAHTYARTLKMHTEAESVRSLTYFVFAQQKSPALFPAFSPKYVPSFGKHYI